MSTPFRCNAEHFNMDTFHSFIIIQQSVLPLKYSITFLEFSIETRQCDHKKICRRTKSARSSVMTFLAAARDLPQNVIPVTKPRSGRPPKTSKHTDDVRRQELHRKHHLSASELKEILQNHLGNVSIRCIEKRMKKDLMISSHRATSKTLLIPRKRKKRLQFVLRSLHWSVDDMKKVVWSDETTFQCISSNEYRTF